ncbi:DinB family protein [Mycobacterium sp. WMMD1722]|uniref:DinB family protein n=1 Tax=Mycobacterium sp. WMMD1722 TaxID=3404117 RepID=UPI003BF5A787
MNLTEELVDQLELHWTGQLRPRLDGLTDDEYFWKPVPDCWTVHRDGAAGSSDAARGKPRVDFSYPAPDPEPFTTIAWRMAHVIVGVFAMRNHSHFGGPPADYESWSYATDAATALAQLDTEYSRWISGVRGLDDDALARPCGPAEGPYGHRPMVTLVLHIHREVIHHGAEIACLRDLYTHSPKEI